MNENEESREARPPSPPPPPPPPVPAAQPATERIRRAREWEAATAARPEAPPERPRVRPIALLGSLALVAAAFLPLIRFRFETPLVGVPFNFLYTGEGGYELNPVSVGMTLAGIGAVAIVLSFTPALSILRRLCGLGAMVIVGLLVGQLVASTDFSSTFSNLGVGVYLGFGAGVLVLAA